MDEKSLPNFSLRHQCEKDDRNIIKAKDGG